MNTVFPTFLLKEYGFDFLFYMLSSGKKRPVALSQPAAPLGDLCVRHPSPKTTRTGRAGGGKASGAAVEWQVTNSKVRNTSDPTSIFIFLAELAVCACQHIPKPEPIGKKREQEAMWWKIGCAHPGKSWWAAMSLKSSNLHSAIGRQTCLNTGEPWQEESLLAMMIPQNHS